MALKKSEKKIKVTRVKQFGNGNIVFDVNINDVSIYNASWMEGEKNGKDYRFVSFPSKKGKDKEGEECYYNHVYVKLSNDELDEIEKQISEKL